MRTARHVLAAFAVLALLGCTGMAEPLVLVQEGTAKANIYHSGEAGRAAKDLADNLGSMSGATVAVKKVEGAGGVPDGPAIVLGELALKMGLPRPPGTVSRDGYRVLRRGQRLLMAGESADSTFYASSHFLESQGCRWFFGNKIGTVIPQKKTIAVEKINVAEKPDFISRRVWGPNWRSPGWHLHNRCGGMSLSAGHDWGHVPPKKYAEEHPEYYSLRGGKRRPGNWLCTSNPDVQRIFAESVIEGVKDKGVCSVSISPPDGRGYCQCEKCTALDDTDYREPSSGSVVITDRYVRFFAEVGRRVQKVNPDAILNFYAYADYSRPPIHVKKAPENLCAWVAPIRYCRFHSLSNPRCPARQRLRKELGQWQEVVSKIGWREYNYNLAASIAPLSKMSVWKSDIPLLHKMGCIGLNIECLYFWHIYGPHTYLVTRLAWDADADVDAIMDDFYTKFCGAAAPHVKAYWERIDRAYRETDIHVGSFYGLHVVWTPELVKACEGDLDAAAKAARREIVRKRVAMFRMGLDNVRFYLDLRAATNACDFQRAKKVYDRWIAHMDGIHKGGIHHIGEYKYGYVPRFLGKTVTQGAARTSGDNTMLVRLPDRWWFRYDPKDEGEKRGWHEGEVGGEGWKRVHTCTATLAEQGIEEVLTWLWYRTEVEVPEIPADRRVMLWFGEVDGKPTKVWVNGELIGQTRASRRPFEMDVTGKLRKGKNTVTAKIDHRHISELSLGGIIKPVMIYTAPKEK